MSVNHQNQSDRASASSLSQTIFNMLGTLAVIGSIFVIVMFILTPAGQTMTKSLTSLFAADSIQLWWYVTRAAGIVAYLLLWFSMILGLAVSSKYLDGLLDRMFTYDFHQFISLLSIGFVLLHVLVLIFDRYLPYSVWQILIPFISPYRPFWVGIGVFAFYIIFLVTVTFYIRRWIGMQAFRVIHILSLVGYLGATLHGLYAGTDSTLPAMRLLYIVTGLIVVFWTVFWLALLGLQKLKASRENLAANQLSHQHHTHLR